MSHSFPPSIEKNLCLYTNWAWKGNFLVRRNYLSQHPEWEDESDANRKAVR